MTICDYYSIPLRTGILILVLSFAAMANMILSLVGVMDATLFKCVIAIWALMGCVGVDVSKNGIRQWRRQMRELKYQARSLLRSEDELGSLVGSIDPRAHVDGK